VSTQLQRRCTCVKHHSWPTISRRRVVSALKWALRQPVGVVLATSIGHGQRKAGCTTSARHAESRGAEERPGARPGRAPLPSPTSPLDSRRPLRSAPSEPARLRIPACRRPGASRPTYPAGAYCWPTPDRTSDQTTPPEGEGQQAPHHDHGRTVTGQAGRAPGADDHHRRDRPPAPQAPSLSQTAAQDPRSDPAQQDPVRAGCLRGLRLGDRVARRAGRTGAPTAGMNVPAIGRRHSVQSSRDPIPRSMRRPAR